ncbi:hypothetical protein ACIO87_32695 [Streptomyces sp. NPDC087218]|uniref:hypothetical protein n=1 Tax=Streptomyces sp. NPDC087218 TaxID=3365769 RepID=UPI00382D0C14
MSGSSRPWNRQPGSEGARGRTADGREPPGQGPSGSPASSASGEYPEYHPGSARPELNRPLHERYPQIRPTSGYGDPRVRHTGPGPGAGTDQEPERSSKLTARLALAMTVVVGQLWGLTVTIDAWMEGNTGTAWWGAGFLALSFLVVLGLWLLDPEDR